MTASKSTSPDEQVPTATYNFDAEEARELSPMLLVWERSSGRSFPLPIVGDVVIGRSPNADVRVHSEAVSRRHAKLGIGPSGLTLEDLGSSNGTRVNGERIDSVRCIRSGDLVTLGDVTLVVADSSSSVERMQASPSARAPSSLVSDTLRVGDHVVTVSDGATERLYTLLQRLAKSELPVLILGETGSGKELAAAAVHHFSGRTGPFVPLNCAAIPETLAESILFGHEKGAFTGALGTKKGVLETASQGTVFFDEIGELPLTLQAKLLRALESRRVMRVGSTEERPIDARVVAATHRDLQARVAGGSFRQDLFYRLSVAQVVVPPLRDRPRELRALMARFLEEASARQGRKVPTMAPEVVRQLETYAWPGNVRELRNLLDFLVVAVPGDVILSEHLADKLQSAPVARPAPPGAAGTAPQAGQGGGGQPKSDLRTANREAERQRLLEALEATGGNRTKAAEWLGIPVRTFFDKLKRHGI